VKILAENFPHEGYVGLLTAMRTSPEAWQRMKAAHSEEIVNESYLGFLGSKCTQKESEKLLGIFLQLGFLGLSKAIMSSPETWKKMKVMYAEEIVKESYLGFFGREADPKGLKGLVGRFEEIGYSGLLTEMRTSKEAWSRMQISHAETIIRESYHGVLGREADEEGLAAFIQRFSNIGYRGLLTEMRTSREAWEAMKVAHAEEIIRESYLGVLGREGDLEGIGRLKGKFSETGYVGVLQQIRNSPEAWETMKVAHAEEIVRESYLGVLGREGDREGIESLSKHFEGMGYVGLLTEMRNSKEAWEKIQEIQETRKSSQPLIAQSSTASEDNDIVILQNSSLNDKALILRSLLKTQSVIGKTMIRVGRDFDGGYVMVNHKLENSICYSLGISDDDSWDRDMANLGCHVYQYDHTIKEFPSKHPNFHSFKIGICALNSDLDYLDTIPNLLKKNNHDSEKDLILKMDIEGCEWDIFEEIGEDILNQFSQIVVEMHNFLDSHHGHIIDKYIRILNKLIKQHQIVHIHANNCGPFGLVNGVPMADTYEITLARKRDHDFEDCKKLFPTALDMPCEPRRPDYFLGMMGVSSQ
jgi:Methyltransferase FkbM domain